MYQSHKQVIIEAILNGFSIRLDSAFTWYLHKFGHGFWANQQRRLGAGKPLTTKARKELESMVQELKSVKLGYPAGDE